MTNLKVIEGGPRLGDVSQEALVHGAQKAHGISPMISSLKVDRLTIGTLFQAGGIWIGAHYSKDERRWCINFLPCLTIYVVLKGGNLPKRKLKMPKL
jgi:hypothetical protein